MQLLLSCGSQVTVKTQSVGHRLSGSPIPSAISSFSFDVSPWGIETEDALESVQVFFFVLFVYLLLI